MPKLDNINSHPQAPQQSIGRTDVLSKLGKIGDRVWSLAFVASGLLELIGRKFVLDEHVRTNLASASTSLLVLTVGGAVLGGADMLRDIWESRKAVRVPVEHKEA